MNVKCKLCGFGYDDEKMYQYPQCPRCFEIAIRDRDIFNWIKDVAETAVENAVWDAGAHLASHEKKKKHETNKHYSRCG